MKRNLKILLAVFLSFTLLCPAGILAAADPSASQKTQQVLDYLVSLPGRPDNRVVSGQFDGWISGFDDASGRVYQNTGYWVGLIGVDYYGGDGADNWNFNKANPILIDYAQRGGLVTVMSHSPNPVTGRFGIWPNMDLTYVDFNQMITPGTSLNIAWNNELDRIASGLQQLEDNDIPVLFRPFHELNGVWFWWGGHNTEEFKAVWRYTFNYMTGTKGLHNLLWVYSPNAGVGNYLEYYPGSDYVDVVGLDYYGSGSLPRVGGYDELITLGKPFAITEFGPCSSSGQGCTAKDSTLIIQGIRNNMPKTAYWMSWNDVFALDNHLNVKQLLEDPWVVTRDEISLSGDPPSCGDGSCDPGETCPQDSCCNGQSYTSSQVCCSGTVYTGNCCSSSDCVSQNTCINHACSQPSSTPIAWWKLDEGSVVTAQDSSGNGNNGTLVNGPAWTTGRIGNALSFDGNNQYVDMGNVLNFGAGQDFSISFWVKSSGNPAYETIISKGDGLNPDQWEIRDDWDANSQIIFRNNDVNSFGVGSVFDNNWHHIVFTIARGGTTYAYKDGAQVSSIASSNWGTFSNSYSLNIGRRSAYGGVEYFNGTIDDVRIYNRALSSQEIQGLYNSQPQIHEADNNPQDGCVSDLELTAFISRWYVSNQDVTITELIQAIGLWKAGGC